MRTEASAFPASPLTVWVGPMRYVFAPGRDVVVGYGPGCDIPLDRPGSAAPPPRRRTRMWCCASPGPTGWPSIGAPTASSSTAPGCRRSTSATVRRSRSVIRSAVRGWFSKSAPRRSARTTSRPAPTPGLPARARPPPAPSSAGSAPPRTATPQLPPAAAGAAPAVPADPAAPQPPDRSPTCGADRAGHRSARSAAQPPPTMPSAAATAVRRRRHRRPPCAARSSRAAAVTDEQPQAPGLIERMITRKLRVPRLLPHPRAGLHLSVAAATRRAHHRGGRIPAGAYRRRARDARRTSRSRRVRAR